MIFAGLRMVFQSEQGMKPENNLLLRLLRRVVPISESYDNGRFFTRQAGALLVTPLFVALLVVETTDLLFAVDSIPAVFAVTQDPFIVYTSNVFAILGLRSLYFVFAGIVEKFYYLKPALALILIAVGVKMLLADLVYIPIWLSLLFIATVLAGALLASWLRARHVASSAQDGQPQN